MFQNQLSEKSPVLQIKKTLHEISPASSLPAPEVSEVRGPRSGQEGQTPISCPSALVSQGIDTLYLTVNATIPERLLEELKQKKSEVQNGTDDCLYLPFGETKLFAFNLQRTGRTLYPYILKTGDFTVSLSTRPLDSAMPNMQVTVGSMACNNDLVGLLKSFRKWCFYHQIFIKDEKVSRVDLYADLALDTEKLSLWNQAKMVTKAEKCALFYSNRRITGCQIGAGDIVLRMYDKIHEMTDKVAQHKADFFQAIWGGVKQVTRVEYQLRRPAIKAMCLDKTTFADMVAKVPEMWSYLTKKWFRQTAIAVDRLNRNQGKATISAFWVQVQAAFESQDKETATRDKNLKTINIKALIDQAAGIMLTVCAAADHAHDDLFGIFNTSADLIKARILEVMDSVFYERQFYARAVNAKISF